MTPENLFSSNSPHLSVQALSAFTGDNPQEQLLHLREVYLCINCEERTTTWVKSSPEIGTRSSGRKGKKKEILI